MRNAGLDEAQAGIKILSITNYLSENCIYYTASVINNMNQSSVILYPLASIAIESSSALRNTEIKVGIMMGI